ncbi:MAG: N-acetylmuramidase family protein [Terracidiphilus sp.]|jgi:peptidoglycan hydrolase-like protein with peptidoglycan-binding domain
MATLPFPCVAAPLSPNGVQNAINTLGIDAPTLWAMLHVESLGCGYLASRRPQILFERHIFSHLTKGVWDAAAPNLSNPQAGGYGPSGESQYTRLGQAYGLNSADPADPSVPTPTRNAALQSASWGLGQVLGTNATAVGFASIQDMVTSMTASEDGQLQAVVGFIQDNNLQNALQQQDWATYAEKYNGPNYAKNQYDTKLAQAYALYQDVAKIPDLTIRGGQLLLLLLGFDPGGVDGAIGPHTLTALHSFQSQQQLPLTTGIDANVLAALTAALPPAPNLSLN